MIYPRLSPNGLHVAGGNTQIFVNNIPAPPIPGEDIAYGTSPVWADESTIYYTYNRPGHPNDGYLCRLNFPVASHGFMLNELSGNILTAGGGAYAVWRPNYGVKASNMLIPEPDWHSPALSRGGLLAHGILEDGTSNYEWGGTTCARENGWTNKIEIHSDVNNPSLNWQDAGLEPNCGKPKPVWTGRELFLLFHTNDGCVFLMEMGSRLGYVIKPRGWDGGSGYTHDAERLDSNRIRVVSPGFDEIVDLSTERIPLPPLEEPEPEPEPEPPDMSCKPVVPPQDVVSASCNELRRFCQEYEFNGQKPYINDELHENGLFLADGLTYFMMSDTGLWAQILMNPDDKRPWDDKRRDADSALQKYMRNRVGDFT